jgi:cardiolipin synthase
VDRVIRSQLRAALTAPNLLTLSRFVLAPVFLALYVSGETVRALAAFAAAAATDVLDGLLARALDQKSRLGAILDPIADKFLAACALFALAARDRLPAWLPILVVSRDLAQLAGAAVLRVVHREVPVAPTRIGKYATFFLATTVVTALAAEFAAWDPATAGPLVAALALLAAECVAVSFAQYFVYFVRSLRRGGARVAGGEPPATW